MLKEFILQKEILKLPNPWDLKENSGILGLLMASFLKDIISLLNLVGELMKSGNLRTPILIEKVPNVLSIWQNLEWVFRSNLGVQLLDLSMDFSWLMMKQFQSQTTSLSEMEMKLCIDLLATTLIILVKMQLSHLLKQLEVEKFHKNGKLLKKILFQELMNLEFFFTDTQKMPIGTDPSWVSKTLASLLKIRMPQHCKCVLQS